ncbi:MAG: hypothetical protein QXU18_02300 [Thermoplasmatales archaeon]
MGVIKRSYSENFYFWPIEKEKRNDSILKWESGKKAPIVVYHPFLRFDPISNFDRQIGMLARDHSDLNWGISEINSFLESKYIPAEDKLTPIVHEKIKAKFDFFGSLNLLLTRIEYYYKIPENNWLWDNTGYWSAKGSRFGYMGISEKSALDLWNQSDELTLCYIASNASSLLEFILDKREENSFFLNIYYSNEFSAFPDLIDAVHKALDEIGQWEALKIEKNDHEIIFNYKPNISELTNDEKFASFPIIPYRVMPFGEDPPVGTDFLYAVIVENTFFKIHNWMKIPEGYAIVTRSGGWLKDDFQAKKRYQTFFRRVRKLENCFLVSISVREVKEMNSLSDFILK